MFSKLEPIIKALNQYGNELTLMVLDCKYIHIKIPFHVLFSSLVNGWYCYLEYMIHTLWDDKKGFSYWATINLMTKMIPNNFLQIVKL